jgi:D-alanyl-D-alanine carboxypeptidase/D-alanyl-D-alanine-endopeptidase (penicillin-binding protein 4)
MTAELAPPREAGITLSVKRHKQKFCAMWSRPLACALLLLPAQALAGAKEKVAALAPSGLVLVMDDKGNELVAQNADQPFVPASVAKIVTAWLAMEVLGGDYRFETSFYMDDKRVLYVRGGGDPFLISEELAPLATELVAAIGKEPVTGIVLDASYYPPTFAFRASRIPARPMTR